VLALTARRRLAVVLAVSSLLAPRVARADAAACVAAAERFQQERDEHKYRAARVDLAICGREDCPATVRSDCVHWLLELDSAVPTLVVRVRDPAGVELDDAEVAIDGEVVSERTDGKPIFVDPGSHVVRVRARGGAVKEQRLVVQTGEKNRIVELRFGGASAANSGAKSGDAMTERRSGALPWVLGAGGILALGAGGVFAAVALSDRSDLRAQPCAATATCSRGDVDRVNRELLFADIGIGVGIVALGIAAYLFLAPSSQAVDRRPVPR
jgi:hypothetical protein